MTVKILPLFRGSGDHNKILSEKKVRKNIGVRRSGLGKISGQREFYIGVEVQGKFYLLNFWLNLRVFMYFRCFLYVFGHC